MTHQNSLHIEGFFDTATSTVSHIVLDQATRQCALLDTVLDYDPKAGRTSYASAERLASRVHALGQAVC